MLESIFDELGTIVTGIVDLFGGLFTKVINLIYDSSATTPALTSVGKLMLIGMAVGLFFFVLSWIRGLIKVRAR